MPRPPTPIHCFSVVIVRKENTFLIVQEKDGSWYLPAGRVETGETFAQAAIRETLEESAIPVVLDGILRVEHLPRATGSSRMRVVFVGHPADDTPPKQVPDHDTLQARWVTLDELQGLPQRGYELSQLFAHVATNPPLAPVDFIIEEGSPYSPGPGWRLSAKLRQLFGL